MKTVLHRRVSKAEGFACIDDDVLPHLVIGLTDGRIGGGPVPDELAIGVLIGGHEVARLPEEALGDLYTRAKRLHRLPDPRSVPVLMLLYRPEVMR